MKESFIKYIQYEKRYSSHTVTAYQNDLNQFYDFLAKTYDVKDIAEVNHLYIRSWIVSLMESKITPRSINRKITTLKTYYKFLLREGIVEQNPMIKILSPKTSKRLPVFVDKGTMDHLLDHVEFGEDFMGLRDKFILELFYATGMRLAELVGLKVNSIDLFNNNLKVLGKRNKERIIPFSVPMKSLIIKYLELKKGDDLMKQTDYLFLNKYGKQISREQVQVLVKKYLSMVTTLDKKSPHVLRHSFATNMLNNGAEINSVKELLGHASLAATQVYTHNTIEKLKNIHKQAHPKA
jgi:integrase/recombinase XerC